MANRSSVTYKYTEVRCTKDEKQGIELKNEYKILMDIIRNSSFGGKRRNMIYELMKSGIEIRVNGKHCPQTNKDPDLLRLIKEGKLEMFNVPVSFYGNRLRCKHTYLRVKNG